MSDRPLTDRAIVLASLPDNALHAEATSPDGRTVDAQVSAQRSWSNGWGFGAYVRARLGAGRKGANPEAGIVVDKKFGGRK